MPTRRTKSERYEHLTQPRPPAWGDNLDELDHAARGVLIPETRAVRDCSRTIPTADRERVTRDYAAAAGLTVMRYRDGQWRPAPPPIPEWLG